jgi:LysR family nitrogen assimilation transcriptional regulator
MKLQQILTFVTVYQEKSFTAAAERIHATQSGLSMQIKELEDRIGVKLFDRSPKGVEPTVAGRKLYGTALDLVRQVEALREEMRTIKGEVSGSVSIGLMPTFTRSTLAPVIADFAAACPYVELKVFEAYSAVLTEMVCREQLDFAIVPPTAAMDGIFQEYIGRDREVLVTSVRTSHRHLEPVSLKNAGPLKLILPSAGNARRQKLDRHLATVGATVGSTIEMDAMMATLSLIEHSDWCSILPATLCHPDLDGTRRKLHPLESPELTVDYVLITSAATVLSSAARQFADGLVKQIRETCSHWSDMELRQATNDRKA